MHKNNAQKRAHLAVVPNQPEGEGVIDSPAVVVPPGIYRVAFKHWYTGIMFGRAKKLALVFKVVDFGPFFEATLQRWYNVQRFINQTGRNGGFTVGPHSDLVREFASLCGSVQRRDRIPLTAYRNLVVLAEVETVTSDSRQRPLAEGAQYSIIRRLLSVDAGQARVAA